MKGHQMLWLVSMSQDVEYKVSARWIFQGRFHERGLYLLRRDTAQAGSAEPHVSAIEARPFRPVEHQERPR